MKKHLLILLSFIAVTARLNAQYCGNSGPTVCTPDTTITEPGIWPKYDSIPSLINGTEADITLQLKNNSQFTFAGQTVTVISLKIETIENLPHWTCWATNVANNTFTTGQNGCIKISGPVCADPGQYKLYVFFTADIGIPNPPTNGDETIKLYIRVKNAGDPDVAVDTMQTQPFQKLPGYSATAMGCNTGINDVEDLSSLMILPNPFNDKAVVSFYSTKGGIMTEKITNMIGSEVYSSTIDVKVGENSSVIAKNTLSAGVYFYTLADGKNSITRRIVITE